MRLAALLMAFGMLSCIPSEAQAQVSKFKFPESGALVVTAFDNEHIDPVQEKFDKLVSSGQKQILFSINSFGGEIDLGMDFIKHIEDAKKHGVHIQCVVDYKAMSMGFVFLQSVCDDRYMTRRSILLAHNGSSSVQGSLSQVEEESEMLKALSHSLSTICANRLGMPIDQYEEKIHAHAWIMNYEDAVKFHAIDGIVDPMDVPPDIKLDKTDPIPLLFRLLHP